MSDERRTASLSAQLVGPTLTRGQLRVLDGPDRGLSREIGSTAIVVGADAGCDVVLRDRSVSRRHCEISLQPRGFLVRDLGSRNGTVFEGSRVVEIAVPAGAIVAIGATNVTLGAPASNPTLEASERTSLGPLVGRSLVMRRTFTLLERAAATDATVLIGGETGTGKELAAEALHLASRRAAGPLEIFDCGAVPGSLFVRELCGHERGAFTGADQTRAGALERANGGTLFLDEIGELPLDVQPSLLRVLESGRVARLGSARPVDVDVRFVAATRRDLPAEVVDARFREDLYYRLAVVQVTLPSLRERMEDLPLLCDHLLRGLGVDDPGPIDGPGLAQLMGHSWPGNVRELRNVLQRAVARASGERRFVDLAFELDAAPSREIGLSFGELKKEAAERFEERFLRDLVRVHGGNLRQASRASGIERMQLKRLLKKHGLH